LIETPPANRLPVVTFVEPYDSQLVKLAILRELNRGGQVFYLHNRIEELEKVTKNLRELFPEARLTVVHGQLDQEDLELSMWGFSQGEYDIMVCTTIIEAGLDLPRANTLIVDDAERLGLAQIYQLRGRVGRSDRQAYAYFLYNPASLTQAGWERLKAVAELSDLGSGLKLALKDLQIRGAGSLFGAEQHGHIKAVGFDLYTQLIEEAVREIKGEVLKPKTILLDLGLSAFIPESYLPDERLRLEVYHRLAEVEKEKDLKDLKAEILDRFGFPPPEVENLFKAVEIRLLAEELGIGEVKVRKEGIFLKATDLDRLARIAPAGFVFKKRFNSLVLEPPVTSVEEKVSYLKSFLNGIIQKVIAVG
jgi:transcription-repair coupling factor (superfamily II helicase)